MNMKAIKPKLNRLPLTTTIPLDKIYSKREVVQDDIFFKKYVRFLNGEKQALLTRMPLGDIKNGFYQRSGSGFVSIVDAPPEDHITYVIDLIRSGRRPQIYIYI